MFVEDAKKILNPDEGLSLTAYPDGRGYSIGRGHFICDKALVEVLKTLGPGIHLSITPDLAEALFEEDVLNATQEMIWLLGAAWPDIVRARKTILVCLSYQLGVEQLRVDFPQFVAAVKRGDWERAAAELLWRDGVTKVDESPYAQQTPARARRYAACLRVGNLGPIEAGHITE
jgi:GH24 family phage-related lysozyme (muramidase)